jgi:CBS-domain-containing membrane protein
MNLAGLENELWLSGALAVALTLAAQELSTSVQPAGGVTALCYVLVSPMQRLSYVYVLCPAFLGSVVMVTLGMLVNNLSPLRIYPQGWWFDQEDVLAQRSAGQSGSSSVGYFAKFAGAGVPEPPRPSIAETGFSFFGSFTAIAVAGLLQVHLLPQITSVPLELLVGTLGASAITIFGASNQPEAQPRVALLGSVIGGFMGLVAVLAVGSFSQMLWLTGALAVAGTVFLQEITLSVHPAGADLALVYVIRAATAPANPDGSHDVDTAYLLCPCLLGTLLIVLVGLVINNLSKQRAYPQSWC